MKLPVVNHPDYVAKINDDNKFPIKKFGALADYLLNDNIVEKFYTPKLSLRRTPFFKHINTILDNHYDKNNYK